MRHFAATISFLFGSRLCGWMLRGLCTVVLQSYICTGSAAAIAPKLVQDINTVPEEVRLQENWNLGGRLVARISDAQHGSELWSLGDSWADSTILKDINPGPTNSNPGDMGAIVRGDELYFSAHSSEGVTSLWKTNGTPAGTRVVFGNGREANQRERSIWPVGQTDRFIFFIESVVFLDTGRAQTLWALNPASSQKFPLAALPAFSFSAGASAGVGTYGATFVFGVGGELWTSDGSPIGTHSITPRIGSATSNFLRLGALVISMADSQIWSSDGITADRLPLTPVTNSASPTSILNGRFFFRCLNEDSTGVCFCSTDGSIQGTRRTITLEANESLTSELYANGQAGVFVSSRAGAPGETQYSIWSTTGSFEQTLRLRRTTTLPIPFDTGGPVADSSGPTERSWFFREGDDVWISNGSVEGTRPVVTPSAPFHFLTAMASTRGIYLRYQSTTDGAYETFLVRPGDFAPKLVALEDGNATQSSNPRMLGVLGDRVIFLADDHVHGRRLWSSDGNSTGTMMVDVPIENTIQFISGGSAALSAAVLFQSSEGNKYGLWVSDGTAAGTHRITSFESLGYSMPVLNDVAYFAADGGAGRALWRSDGTIPGTFEVANLAGGNGDSNPSALTTAAKNIFFLSRTADGAVVLASSDGTHGGTRYVKRWSTDALPLGLRGTTKGLFFVATDESGRELWYSDGTESGTNRVVDLNPGPASAFADPNTQAVALIAVGEKVYFRATDQARPALWVSDGTAAGTKIVFRPNLDEADLRLLGPYKVFRTGSGAEGLTSDRFVYFETTKKLGGHSRLFVFDTQQQVANEITPETSDDQIANIAYIVERRGSAIAGASSSRYGGELWQINPASHRYALFADLNPGAVDSYPSDLISAGENIVLVAFTPQTGQEPYVIPNYSCTIDGDADGIPDCRDSCPNDPAKNGPGVCGCNTSEVDNDGDGIVECTDTCPSDPIKSSPGVCGCGFLDQDLNANKIIDCVEAYSILSMVPPKARLKYLRKKKEIVVYLGARQNFLYRVTITVTPPKKPGTRRRKPRVISKTIAVPKLIIKQPKPGAIIRVIYRFVDGASNVSRPSISVRIRVKNPS